MTAYPKFVIIIENILKNFQSKVPLYSFFKHDKFRIYAKMKNQLVFYFTELGEKEWENDRKFK
ncbi:hypothetical protein AA988_08995 [Enterococcus cecorum]|nr:hypothetical protein AA988_08995 [Enterococcus cecorum]